MIKGRVLNGREVVQVLKTVAPREAFNLARSTTLAVAREAAEDIKLLAPDDPATRTSRIRKNTKPKRDRSRGTLIRASVRIYWFVWRFLEHGTRKGNRLYPRRFVDRAVEGLRPEVPALWRFHFGQKLEARIRARAKKNLKRATSLSAARDSFATQRANLRRMGVGLNG